MFLYDPNSALSPHFTLGQLTKTSQPLSMPNMPENTSQYDNLVLTADVLEQLNHYIGPFQIISGFRTKELQQALGEGGAPVAAGTSFHELGRAVDIYPTTMPLAEYFGLILANENIKNLFAEISIKPGQNSLHLAINVPGDVRTPKILGLNESGSYVRLTLDEIANYIAPFMNSVDDAYQYASAQLVTWNKTPLILGMVAAAGGVIYLALASPARKTNPRVKVKPHQPKGIYDDQKSLTHLSVPALKAMMKKYKKYGTAKNAGIENQFCREKYFMAKDELERRHKRKFNPRTRKNGIIGRHLSDEKLKKAADQMRRKYSHLFNRPMSQVIRTATRTDAKRIYQFEGLARELKRRGIKIK